MPKTPTQQISETCNTTSEAHSFIFYRTFLTPSFICLKEESSLHIHMVTRVRRYRQ